MNVLAAHRRRFRGGAIAAALLATLAAAAASAQPPEPAPPGAEEPAVPDRVALRAADDAAIQRRLEGILTTAEEWTDWLKAPRVRVEDGVVFLAGGARSAERRAWVEDLALRTEGVVAVVNQIELLEPPLLDFQPALAELRRLWRGAVRGLATFGVGLAIVAAGFLAALLAGRGVRVALRPRVETRLLREVVARSAAALVFLGGVYVALQVIGLTRLAVTVLGGTGLVGLVLGIAFRDITENFLASVFLSMQHPFRTGDLVEIAGAQGFVQRLTTRATILMTQDGNHFQIPNGTVYKSTIRNFTSNPNRREDFTVGIGYDAPTLRAQEIALKVLSEHPAVLADPEPWVLVESLGAATVNLHVYFWLDGSRHSWMKVKSSVVRLVKRAYQEAGISLPDEAREVVFPSAVPVRLLREDGAPAPAPAGPAAAGEAEAEVAATDAEGGLHSEAGQIQEQARRARTPEEGQDLLEDDRRA